MVLVCGCKEIFFFACKTSKLGVETQKGRKGRTHKSGCIHHGSTPSLWGFKSLDRNRNHYLEPLDESSVDFTNV